MPKTYCPECEAVISVDDPREGGKVTCRECGTELQVQWRRCQMTRGKTVPRSKKKTRVEKKRSKRNPKQTR
jgi:DNA-directed RNA polymerase subunit M/transcription elongation factor TFIIS